jgi:hypothetical protein
VASTVTVKSKTWLGAAGIMTAVHGDEQLHL